MRARPLAAAIVAAAMLVAMPAAAAAAQTPLKRPSPSWYTPKLAKQIHKAGAKGKRVREERLNTACPGQQSRGVSAAGCIVDPAGCTANFIFTGGGNHYVGTAAHCTDRVGQPVVMQVNTTTLAEVGTVAKRTSAEEPGEDFALVQIHPDVAAKWGINPAIPVIGGPKGIYTGCGPATVLNYGHGYGALVAQGKPQGGLGTVFNDDGYGWIGPAAPGDSGSPVIVSGGRAAGNLTHLIIDSRDYFGSTIAGTRITKILQFAGVRLVNADRTTTGAASTNCD